MDFILKLLLAHILGDFLFQPNKWIKGKQNKKFYSKYLYYHIGVHLLMLLLIFGFSFKYWLGFLVIIISHFIFDLIKSLLLNKENSGYLFLIDQIAHLGIIAGVTYYYYPFDLNINLLSDKVLLLIIAILLLTNVSSIIIKTIISRWDLGKQIPDSSLKNAGAIIGILERLFVFAFVVTNHWEGIGFLLAAKSVFRFGDLSKADDRKLTEYILIGTMLSFGLAILTGILYQNVVKLL
ncbi:MAG TPA: DUF3307 domain-containing protein [Bacteroidetes bacterium]|nr:DUF3307 domain-containing protein [Bacteroidota bacterium]